MTITTEEYLALRAKLIDIGYSHEIGWAENVQQVSDPLAFWHEFAWVVLNSGMKNQIAKKIWGKVRPAVEAGGRTREVFGHPGKAAAIDYVYDHRDSLLQQYLESSDKIACLQSLPWIGKITCWHLAKNYGINVAKPDRHLVRIAGAEGVDALCGRLAAASGDRVATVDVVIWRAANLGLIVSSRKEGANG